MIGLYWKLPDSMSRLVETIQVGVSAACVCVTASERCTTVPGIVGTELQILVLGRLIINACQFS